ncbi:hypothetical protein Tco_1174803 [Tanacetum coccineum]
MSSHRKDALEALYRIPLLQNETKPKTTVKGRQDLETLKVSKGVVLVLKNKRKLEKPIQTKRTADDNKIRDMKSQTVHKNDASVLPYGVQQYFPKGIAAPIIESGFSTTRKLDDGVSYFLSADTSTVGDAGGSNLRIEKPGMRPLKDFKKQNGNDL